MNVVRYSVSADLKYVLLTHDVQPVNHDTHNYTYLLIGDMSPYI